jgi:hypothetical protein
MALQRSLDFERGARRRQGVGGVLPSVLRLLAACHRAWTPIFTLAGPAGPALCAVLCMKREGESEEDYRARVAKARPEINKRLLVLVHALVQVRSSCMNWLWLLLRSPARIGAWPHELLLGSVAGRTPIQ